MKNKLETYGYVYKKWSSSEKAFVKYVGQIQQQIWEQGVINDGKKTLINITISIADPFRLEGSDVFYLPILAYRLASNEVVIPKSDTGVGRFWNKEESVEAFDSLVKYALPWFEKNSSIEKLIE